jgi:hypothetical protein
MVRYLLKVGLIVAIVIVVTVMVHAFTRHVIHGAVIALTEAFAEIPLGFPSLDRWVLVHLVVVSIGMAMLTEVVPRSFDAFVISALLCVAITVRSLIPTIPVPVLILRCRSGKSRRCDGLSLMRAGFQCASRSHTEGKKRWCKPL